MKQKIVFIYLLLAVFTCNVFAQDIAQESNSYQQLHIAKDLYSRGMYSSAEHILDGLANSIQDKTSALYAEVVANRILCAVSLRRLDIEGLAVNFNNAFPNNPQSEMVKFYLAVNRFDNNEYGGALDLFKSIDNKYLYTSVESEYHFKYGYSSLFMEDYGEAMIQLNKVLGEELNRYTYPAYYYLGFSNYILKDFNKAYDYFEKAKADSRFYELSCYYQVESKFMLKDYDYVIENGKNISGSIAEELKNNLSRIISESYYAKGNIAAADEFFEKYLHSGVTLTEKDRYYAGILAYSLEEYSVAIDAFADVVNSEGLLGQSAAYFSANSYLQLKNKIAALNLFKKASENDSDPVIKEDAFFNFAKLSFDVNSDISQFERYVQEYPNSGKDDVINSYMSVAFLANKNFSSAIEIINRIKNPSTDVLDNLQKARVLRAVQLMNNGGYRSAIPLLVAAIEGNNNPMITLYAKFFYSECLYRNDRFVDAINVGKSISIDRRFQQTSDYEKLKYNLGYAYFKSNDFSNAEQWFVKYLQNNSAKNEMNKDALLRLGDVYFMQSKYEAAAAQYQNVIARYNNVGMYPYYHSAMAYGLNGNDEKKVSVLESVTSFYQNDELYTASVYELGRTYMRIGNATRAQDCFEKLVNYSADSTYFAKALLELAMISSNKQQYKGAIGYYDKIVRAFPYSSEAQDALAGMESIYQMQNNPEAYLAYLDNVGMSNVKSADEKETMIFSAAEQIYLSNNYGSAVSALQNFIKQYPNSSKLAQTYFYLGEVYKATHKSEMAADAYLKSMEAEHGNYSEAATANYADISYSLNHYQQSLEAYETLIQIAQTDVNKIKGHLGKMNSNFGLRQYYKALNDAKEILEMVSVSSNQKREASYISAKSYLVLGQRNEAKEIFSDLALNTMDAIGAESAYTLIQDLYDAGDFINVENKVYEFSESGTSQLYWLAKSFIVLGDSFADREDWKQARATFESIKEGYNSTSNTDDVLEQVEMRLSKLSSLGK